MSSSWSDYRTPCPQCGGTVHFWSFGADCRGNDADSGVACRQCERRFTQEEWRAAAGAELAERECDYWESQYQTFGPYQFSPYHPDYDFSTPKPPQG